MQPPFCLSQCVKNLHTTIFFTANAHTNVELKELAQGNATVQRHIMVKALLQNCILTPPRNEFCLFYAVKCVPK